MIWRYFYNLALGFDQFVNAILLGDPDESISGRTGRAMASGSPKWWVPFMKTHVNWIFRTFFAERDHVENAIEYEEKPIEKELWSWIKE